MISFKKFLEGIKILPKTTSTVSSAGEIDFDTTNNKLNVHNGSSASPLVTEAHTATLTNKTLTSPVITSPTGIVKADVGLDQVDNTSDVNKPVSTAQATYIDSHTTNTNNPHSVTAAQVGNTTAQWNANKIQGVNVSSTTPTDGQYLRYISANSRWEPSNAGTVTSPTIQTFTGGSGNYTTPVGVKYIRVRMVAGGGGGQGSKSDGWSVAGGNGTETKFGGTLLVCSPGAGGNIFGGGPGGYSIGTGAIGFGIHGSGGNCGTTKIAGQDNPSGAGGGSFFGGGGGATIGGNPGNGGVQNTGGGGGGGALSSGQGNGGATCGAGGGAGGYIDAIIPNPHSINSGVFAYQVGAGGGFGGAGTNGFVGGSGAAGIIIVEEYY